MNYKNVYDRLIEKRRNHVIEDGYFEKHHATPKALGGTDEKQNIVRLTAREHFIAHLLLARIHGGSMWSAIHYMMHPKSKSAKGVKVSSRAYQTVKEKDSAWRKIAYAGENNYWYGKKIPLEFREKMRGPRPNIQGENHVNYGKKFHEDFGFVISQIHKYKYNPPVIDYTVRDRINKMLGINRGVNCRNDEYDIKSKEIRDLGRYFRGIHIGKKAAERDTTGKNNSNYGNGQAIAGEKNPMFGKVHKKETVQKIREKALKREKIKCPFCEVVGIKPNMNRWHFDNCKRKVA